MDDVSAWMCEQCGEVLFDEETVRAIQEMLRELGDRVERLTALSLATA